MTTHIDLADKHQLIRALRAAGVCSKLIPGNPRQASAHVVRTAAKKAYRALGSKFEDLVRAERVGEFQRKQRPL